MRGKRAVCPEPGRIVVEEFDVGLPGSDELLVETELTLVSPGTERAWFLKSGGAPVRFPYYPGYCQVGKVVSVGDRVTRFKAGDRVVSHAHHASAARVREDGAYHVPAGVSAETAAFTPLAAISLQGVRKANIELGTSVGLIGAGLIGLLALRFARLSGAYPVIATDLSESRRSLAARQGAQRSVGVEEFLEAARTHERRPTPDPGFEVIIDATGHPAAFATALEACGNQGTVVLLGSTRGLADQVNVYLIHQKGIHIVGAHNRIRPGSESVRGLWTRRDDFELILRLMRDRILSVSELITDDVRPADIPDVFARLEQRDEGMLGCVIRWC